MPAPTPCDPAASYAYVYGAGCQLENGWVGSWLKHTPLCLLFHINTELASAQTYYGVQTQTQHTESSQ